MGRRTCGFRLTAPETFRATVWPVTVINEVSISLAWASCFITAGTPPARCRSWIRSGPAGLRWQRFGVVALISLMSLRGMGTPASWAMAVRCSTLLVEQPRAMSTRRALANALGVRTSRGRRPISRTFMICMPACLARRMRAAATAGMVPLPGSAMPMASLRQFIELAVNMPEHEPQPGQAVSS